MTDHTFQDFDSPGKHFIYLHTLIWGKRRQYVLSGILKIWWPSNSALHTTEIFGPETRQDGTEAIMPTCTATGFYF
jgi:hypothetical protein